MPEPLKCDECGATKTKTGVPWNEAGLRIHKARVHGTTKPSSPNGPPEAVKPKKQKRQELTVAFCPCCGINLALVQAAMNVAGRVK
jgi:hypothetical protein